MFTYIIIIAVVIFIGAWFLNLEDSNKRKVVDFTIKGTTIGSTYALSQGKATVKGLVTAGQLAAVETELQAQDVIDGMGNLNTTVDEEGGAIKFAAKHAKDHREFIGLDQTIKDMHQHLRERRAELKARTSVA